MPEAVSKKIREEAGVKGMPAKSWRRGHDFAMGHHHGWEVSRVEDVMHRSAAGRRVAEGVARGGRDGRGGGRGGGMSVEGPAAEGYRTSAAALERMGGMNDASMSRRSRL